MTIIKFTNFHFRTVKQELIVTFAQRYEFKVPLEEITTIDSEVKVNGKELEFPNLSEKSADNKINRIINKGLHNLTHKINGKKVVYIDEESGIPLIGSGEFGVIDRNSSLLEVKTHTGCNLNCTYCSVNEGINNKTSDFLIDPYFLAQTCNELASRKKHPVEFNLGPHGEPLLYPFTEELLKELSQIPNCSCISVNTNGIMLSPELIDMLKKNGLGRINLSLNTLDEKTADNISGKKYPTKHVLEMVEYCKQVGLPVLLAPLVIKGYTDDIEKDMAPLCALATTIQESIDSPWPVIGFQNFLTYKGGRNLAKQMDWKIFYDKLDILQERYPQLKLKLKEGENPFNIFADTKLEKPMQKNDIVKVDIKLPGRTPTEKISTANGRIITIKGCTKEKGTIKVKIVRDKHNIFIGAII